ncbi:MAG: hypothetical protein K2Y71_30325 [Xanthobacteraceae bacterium]|nr:hypothetical protein [Xanthobacteraceae bacterium]MBX9829408.1 hypothetical protein [Xanthobacteraceae bacterium]
MLRIAFLHVGQETVLARILVRSIRAHNPDVHVTQCTDGASPAVAGVDEVVRLDSDTGRLMTFRLRSFAGLPISEPTLFLDTDMVCTDRIDAAAELGQHDVCVCVREFNKDMLLDPHAMNLDLREYEGRTLNEVYPHLACAVIAKTPEFWSACLDNLMSLPEKFHHWFGDQEAIRNVIAGGGWSVGSLPESRYACLPHEVDDPAHRPKLFHFKGPMRKQMMIDGARAAGWL